MGRRREPEQGQFHLQRRDKLRNSTYLATWSSAVKEQKSSCRFQVNDTTLGMERSTERKAETSHAMTVASQKKEGRTTKQKRAHPGGEQAA